MDKQFDRQLERAVRFFLQGLELGKLTDRVSTDGKTLWVKCHPVLFWRAGEVQIGEEPAFPDTDTYMARWMVRALVPALQRELSKVKELN